MINWLIKISNILTSSNSSLTRDKWLSDCLDFDCYTYSVSREASEIKVPERTPLFVSAKVGSSDHQSYQLLKKAGFRQVNRQITLVKELKVNPHTTQFHRELASPYRIKIQESITNPEPFSGLFVFDRFNADKRLPSDWSEKIKNKWIRSDTGKKFISAYYEQREIGFILFKLGTEFVIDLVCVLDGFQGNGVGRAMLYALEEFAHSQNVKKLVVGTQDNNENSLKMYRKFGFDLQDQKIVMHFYRELVSDGKLN